MKISLRVKSVLMAAVFVAASLGVVFANKAFADVDCGNGKRATSYAQCGMDVTADVVPNSPLEDQVQTIINGVLYVVGVLAVVMVIIGGVKYTTSGGDQAAVTSAKNTILYGIVGLIIAILAYAIVNFVIGKIAG